MDSVPRHSPSSPSELLPEAARALLAATAEPARECENCGKPLTGRQERACSGPCRTTLSRKRQSDTRAQQDARILTLICEAGHLLDKARMLIAARKE
jgi:predicted nucleic acid-binding Zn ribbon protein